MISDWRGDRRIGSPTFGERWADPLRFGLIGIAVFAATAALLVLITGWGRPANPFLWTRVWCQLFGWPVLAVTLSGLFGPNKGRSLAFGLLGAALFTAVWFLTLPILAALGIVMIVPIAPVHP